MTGVFGMNGLSYIAILFVFTLVFHYILVWRKNLSKRNWKKIDYIWLSMAAIGLFGIASENRIAFAKNWELIKTGHANGSIAIMQQLADHPEKAYPCSFFGEEDLDEVLKNRLERDFRPACEWRKKLSAWLISLKDFDLPKIEASDIPKVDFKEPHTFETVSWLKDRISEYNASRSKALSYRKISEKSHFEIMLEFLTPYLLCIAIALRITKVTGEIKHEAWR